MTQRKSVASAPRATARSHRLRLREEPEVFGLESNGILMTAKEFDEGEFEEGWCYELINGILVVTPIPLENEADPNGELDRLLRNYGADHPQGNALQATLSERYIPIGENRRKADRIIWAGADRPKRMGIPTIAVEFVSSRKRDRLRDYETKRDEYLGAGVKEYWIIDRFMETMTVFTRKAGRVRTRVFEKDAVYMTSLLPGFELPLKRLFAFANRWKGGEFV